MSGPITETFKDEDLQNIDLAGVVKMHVGRAPYWATKRHNVISSLEELEEEMTQCLSFERTRRYAPLLVAFAILDQLGSTYEDQRQLQPAAGNSIRRALHYFCGIAETDPVSEALYALRNALAHDGALTNCSSKGVWRIFRYNRDITVPIVLPKTPWDGQAQTLGPDTTHTVGVRGVVSLARNAIRFVREMEEERPADLGVRTTKDAIIHKFLFWSASSQVE